MNNFFELVKELRIPLYANLQLTYNCNFYCKHCYQTPLKNKKIDELSTEQWKEIIDILKEKGVIILHFTGGEVLCRKDFIEIYKYAYNLNFKIGISTNASLINNEVIELWSSMRPYKVAITLYGFSEKVYQNFTGKVAFDRVYENILALREKEIPIFIKTIANKINKNNLIDMYNFTKENGINFFSFFKINNFINGDNEPVKLELDEEEIAYYQKKFRQLDKYIEYKSKNKKFEECTVGINIVNIDPLGKMYLCECSQERKISLLKEGFDICWEIIGKEREQEFQVDIECNKCQKRNFCNICPPLIKYRYGKLCKPVKECRYAENIERMVNLYYDKNI